MNLDLAASFNYGDAVGLRDFMLVHRFVHDETAAALAAQKGVSPNTFGVSSSAAEEAWVAAMRDEGEERPRVLRDWLELHATIHQQTYQAIGQVDAPDLSSVDFSDPQQFSDWMFAHQQAHDYEQLNLGLT